MLCLREYIYSYGDTNVADYVTGCSILYIYNKNKNEKQT